MPLKSTQFFAASLSLRASRFHVVSQLCIFALCFHWLHLGSHPTVLASRWYGHFNCFDRALTFLIAWNVGASLYMAWTALACLNQFINSIVWHGNTVNWAPVWCDICKCTRTVSLEGCLSLVLSAARIIVGASMAIPACSLCINRRLYHISQLERTITNAEVCFIHNT